MVRFCLNFKQNIFTCLPIIIYIKIYEWGHLDPPRPPKGKFSIYDVILLKFETQYFPMFTNDN